MYKCIISLRFIIFIWQILCLTIAAVHKDFFLKQMPLDYTSFDSNILGGVVAQQFSVAFGTFPLPVIWEPSASLINPIQAGGG